MGVDEAKRHHRDHEPQTGAGLGDLKFPGRDAEKDAVDEDRYVQHPQHPNHGLGGQVLQAGNEKIAEWDHQIEVGERKQ